MGRTDIDIFVVVGPIKLTRDTLQCDSAIKCHSLNGVFVTMSRCILFAILPSCKKIMTKLESFTSVSFFPLFFFDSVEITNKGSY